MHHVHLSFKGEEKREIYVLSSSIFHLYLMNLIKHSMQQINKAGTKHTIRQIENQHRDDTIKNFWT